MSERDLEAQLRHSPQPPCRVAAASEDGGETTGYGGAYGSKGVVGAASPPRKAPLPHLRFVWCLHFCTWLASGPAWLVTNDHLVCCSCGEDQGGCGCRGGRAGGDAARVLRRGMCASVQQELARLELASLMRFGPGMKGDREARAQWSFRVAAD